MASRRRAGVALGGGLEVGGEERVGELPRDDRLRHDSTLGRGRGFLGGFFLDGRFDAGRFEHLASERLGGVGDLGVLLEEREEGGAAGGGLGKDRGHALEALELLGAVGLGAGLVRLDAGALLAHQQGDHLELRADGGHDGAPLHGPLDFTDSARQHRDDAVVVTSAAALLRPRSGSIGAWSAPPSSGHELLLGE